MTTYVHATHHDADGRYRPTSWHIARLHTRAINGWLAYCGRYFDTTDTMSETPEAATCETCFRYEAKARERMPEDDPTVGQVDPT